MKNTQKILDLAVYAGEILLSNGAELTRVQQTIGHILDAFGMAQHDVYVLANGIFATLDDEDGTRAVAVREIRLGEVHLGRVSAVNTVSREISASRGDCNLDKLHEKLQRCATLPRSPVWLQMLACAMGASSFCYLLGGSPLDCIPPFLAGFVLQGLLTVTKARSSPYIPTILGASIVTVVCSLLFRAGIGMDSNIMITGSIIPLVPGIAITTSIQDFFRGDYLSGGIHLINALMQATCIAVGVVLALQGLALVGLGGAV